MHFRYSEWCEAFKALGRVADKLVLEAGILV